MTPLIGRADVIAAAHMAGQRAAHRRHAGGVLDHPAPDPHHGPLLVRQAATAWHQGFAAAHAELAKTFVPDLVKVGPEGYIHGYICVRPPCGEKPGHIKADDLAVAKDGGIVHRKTGWAVGHVARGDDGLFVAHHANGDRTSHDSRTAALRSVSRKYNRRAAQEAAAPPPAARPGRQVTEPAAAPAGHTYTGLVHATSADNVTGIHRHGFRASVGGGENGAFFGSGTYFHTSQADADQSLEGYRAFIDPTMTQVHAEVTVKKPFVVHATSDDGNPAQVMQRALEAAGLATPGEKLTAPHITSRLKHRGYDAVEVRQDGFNHEIGGSQLVVFDPSTVKVTDDPPADLGSDSEAGWRHAKAAVDGDEETAKRLTAAMHSGLVDSTDPSTTGVQATTSIETFADGSRWIHKQYDPFGTGEDPAETMTARDLLASRLADAIGVESPHVIRTSSNEIYEPFVAGATPGAEMSFSNLDETKSTPAGYRIGLFDALTGHQDRHQGNVLVKANGDPVAIDNNSAWTVLNGDGDLTSWSPFTQQLLSDYGWGKTPIGTAELDHVRARVEALKPEFDKVAADFASLADEADYDTSSMPPEQMYPATMAALARIRGFAADAEAKAAAA